MLLSTTSLLALAAVVAPHTSDAETAALLPARVESRIAAPGGELAVISVPHLVRPFRITATPLIGRCLPFPLFVSSGVDEESLWRAEGWDSRRSHPRSGPGSGGTDELLSEFAIPTGIDNLIENVRMLVGDAPFQKDGTWISGGEQGLLMVLPEDAIQRVKDVQRVWRAAFVPRVRVRYWLVRSDEPLPSGLSMQDAQALLRGLESNSKGEILHAAESTCRPGDLMRLGEHRSLGFVGEMNVEVAQEAGIGDPVERNVEYGHSLVFRVCALPGTAEMAFLGVWTDRDIEAQPERFDLQAKRLRALETVRLRNRQSIFSMRMAPDRVQVFQRGQRPGSDVYAMVACERLDQLPEPVACLEGQVMEFVPVQLMGDLALRGTRGKKSFLPRLGAPLMNLDRLYDTVSNLLPQDFGDDSLQARIIGSQFVVRGAPDRIARVKKVIEFLMRDVGRSFTVVLRREGVPLHEPGAKYRQLGSPLRLDCMAGRNAAFTSVNEQSLVTGYDVEIAQDSVMANPQVAAVLDGVMAFASCEPVGDSVHVRVEILDRVLREIRSIAAAADSVGAARLPVQHEVICEGSRDMKPGEKVTLGSGAVREFEGRPFRTRFTLELLER